MKSLRIVFLSTISLSLILGSTRAKADWVDEYGKKFPTAADACAFNLKKMQQIFKGAKVTLTMTPPSSLTLGLPWPTPTCFFILSNSRTAVVMEVGISPSCPAGFKPDKNALSGCVPIVGSTPQILWNRKEITNTTQQVATGEEIALNASYTVPAGHKVQNQSWSLAPTVSVVGGYSIAGDYSTGRVVPAQFDEQTTVFYFVDSGKSRSVTFSYALDDGQQASAQAIFDVFGPTSPTILTANSHVITVNDQLLEFGDFTISDTSGNPAGKPGIAFNASAAEPPGYQGAFWWVQLLESETTTLRSPSRPLVCQDGEALDTRYPYDTGPTATDSPNMSLASTYIEESKKMSARMFLMWRSARPGAIPVPLGFVRWGWYGDAKYDSVHAAWAVVKSESNAWNNEPRIINIYPEWKAIRKASTCPP